MRGVNKGAHVHRDVNSPHGGVQVNFWFPLADIRSSQCLKIYPELFGKDVSTNDLGRITFRHPELDSPLQVAMEAGDLLVFHSEHLHESPVNSENTSRVSIDCRCAFFCDDDNRYYHGGFEDITSFLGLDLQLDLTHALDEYIEQYSRNRKKGFKSTFKYLVTDFLFGNYHLAIRRLLQRQKQTGLSSNRGYNLPPYLLLRRGKAKLDNEQVADAIQTFRDVIEGYPFSDDRFHHIIEMTHSVDREFCQGVINRFLHETQKPYWAIKLGDFLSLRGDYANAGRAYLRVLALQDVAEELDRQHSHDGISCATRYPYYQPSNKHYVMAAASKLKVLAHYGLVTQDSLCTDTD